MTDIRKRRGTKGDTYQVRYKKSNGKYAFKTFMRRKDAQTFIESLSTQKHVDNSVATVDRAVDLWLNVCEKEGRDGRDPVTGRTLKLYEYRADQIKAYGWDKPLQDLAKPDIVRFRSWLLQNHNRYIAQKALSSFHSVMIEMMQRGYIGHDPVAGVTIKADKDGTTREIPTLSEMRSILKAADELANDTNRQIERTWQRYRPMIWLASGTGMRPQEYIALPRQNVLENEIKVTQAVDDKGKIVKPKTRAGRRTIAVESDILDIVRSYMQEEDAGPLNLVFPTSSGSAQQVNNFRRRAWYPLMEKAGLMIEDEDEVYPKYTPYALRHFYASILIENKVNIKRIQEQMGHADIQTTMDTYGHLIADTEDAKQPATKGVISGLVEEETRHKPATKSRRAQPQTLGKPRGAAERHGE